jgi:cytochrome c peroxidase
MPSRNRKARALLLACTSFSLLAYHATANTATTELGMNDLQTLARRVLGNLLFEDTDLSEPAGQSCASCHASGRAFSDPDQHLSSSEGVHPGRFANRNAPTLGYARYAPPFHYNANKDVYIGGQFHDGRAATLEDQAGQPFLNPLEMANLDKRTVVEKVARSSYAWLFTWLHGDEAFVDVDLAYRRIAEAIAAFERTETFAPFSSKFDHYLKGQTQLSAAEARGMALFSAVDKGNCAACHPLTPINDGKTRLLTDFSYDNLGVPRNPDNPFYTQSSAHNPAGRAYVDRGLGDIIGLPEEMGKFKVPTLRNIALTAPYMHNGYFNDLKSVVQFYNDRDLRPRCADPLWTRAADAQAQGCWPEAEVAENVNNAEIGDLGLTDGEIDDIVAFLDTLTDGWRP